MTWKYGEPLYIAVLLVAFATVVPPTVWIIGLAVALGIWLLRVAGRADMPFSLIGLVIGAAIGLLVPGSHIVEPNTALVGAWLLLALAA